MPHLYWNDLLLDGAALCLVAALALFGGSFVLRRFSKKRLRLSSLASFVLGIALVAANYGLIFVDAYSIAKPGKRAPDLHVRVADGSEVTLDRLRGKIVVLNFFATWCPPCMQEMPHLQEVWEANRDRPDFAMLAIGRDETAESLAEFRSKHQYEFPMYADSDGSVFSSYAESLIPRTYLIARDGTICFACTGFREDRFDELKSILGEQLREPKTGR